mmetsp:Transcript_31809/g.31098  ORF Transcript_31809/g.31098 Transcript_31809/m.31098 type:complete len:208 (+) Transcript_31809:1524-2147(+)
MTLEFKEENEIFISSVLSLVARLPPFDFLNLGGYCYLRLRSDQIIRARSTTMEGLVDKILIVPTDDEKWKLALLLLNQEVPGNLGYVTQQILRTAEEVQGEEDKLKELYLPSFALKSTEPSSSYNNICLFEDAIIKESSQTQDISLVKGKSENCGLIVDLPSASSRSSFVINQSFIFALLDADLEEHIQNMPLITGLVGKESWQPYH